MIRTQSRFVGSLGRVRRCLTPASLTLSAALALFALSNFGCSKKAEEPAETKAESKDKDKEKAKEDEKEKDKDKEKAKDDEAKKDEDPDPVAADEPAEQVEAVPVAADFTEKAATTIKADDYKTKLDDLEKEIGKD